MNKFSSGPKIMDIDELDAFLMSDQMPEDCMQLCDMDGFLTAIAIGPDMIMPSEWIPYITGTQDQGFETEQQAHAFFGGVMEWYNGILSSYDSYAHFTPAYARNYYGLTGFIN